jgi:hypothetical protein
VNETSGLAWLDATGLCTINDGGHDPTLHRLKLDGGTTPVFLSGAQNIDWEDLAVGDGKIFIGDFGNNLQTRRDQKIYFMEQTRLTPDDTLHLDSINNVIAFTLPDQPAGFDKRNRNFDFEAMFYKGNALYLISKSARLGRKSFGKLYRLPAAPGEHVAQLIDSFYFGEPVTAADYDTAANVLVVTGYLSLFVFERFDENNWHNASPRRFRHNRLRQYEGLAVHPEQRSLFISNEKGFGKRAALHTVGIQQLNDTKGNGGVGYAWRRFKLSIVLGLYNLRVNRLNR